MNVIRVYFTTSAILVIAVIVLVVLGHWQWALIPVAMTLGLVAMAVSALIEQQQLTNQLLRQQLSALMGFFDANGIQVETKPPQ